MSDPEELPQPELQPCSVAGCPEAAGAIVDGNLLCFDHAAEALQRRRGSDSDGHF